MSDSPLGGIDATVEAVLVAFLETSDQAMFGYGTDGSISTWNRGGERLVGRPAGDVIGKSFDILFPAHLRQQIRRYDDAARAGDRVDRVLVEVERTDGMVLPVALSLCPVEGPDGMLAGCVAVLDDLTEIRLAQAALAEVERRLDEWEALAHVGRWLWDVAADSVQWSAELHRLHGVEPRDFDGTLAAHLACIHPDDRAPIHMLMAEAVASGHSFDGTYRVVAASDDVRPMDVHGEPTIDSSSTVIGLRGVSRRRSKSSAATGEKPHPLEEI